MATNHNTPPTKPSASRAHPVLGLGFAVLVEEWALSRGKSTNETVTHFQKMLYRWAARRPVKGFAA